MCGRLAQFMSFRFFRESRKYRFGRFSVQGREGFPQGEHRFDEARNALVGEAPLDAAPFDEATNTIGGMLRKQTSPS